MGTVQIDGSTPKITVGNATAEDATILFDGNAQDFYIALDDSADDLVIGLGSTVGTTPAISINEDRDVTISDGAIDFDVASHDGTNGLKLGGTLVTTTAAELNLLDGDTSVGSSITIADADGFVVNDGGTMKTIPATDISTYAGGGITEVDQWCLHTNITGDAYPITSNIAVCELTGWNDDTLGTGMSQSSGVFTFPSTGHWLVMVNMAWYLTDDDDNWLDLLIGTTIDAGSNWYWPVHAASSISDAGDGATNQNLHTSMVIDVTNTSNVQVRFGTDVGNGSTVTRGTNGVGATYQQTKFTFIKLGDT